MKYRSFYQDAPEFCHYFFDLVQSDNLVEELVKIKQATLSLFSSISPEIENYAYAENKWSVKQVLRHIIDCERIYGYRAFRLSRFDNTILSGFDENEYINRNDLSKIQIPDLIREYSIVRDSSIELFKNMSESMLHFRGRIGENYFSTRAIGMMTAGHNIHHNHIIIERYLRK